MPSGMIHLEIAKKSDENASPLFLLGNLAPDCIDIRSIKDHTHFRDRSDRIKALEDLKATTDPNDPFFCGILLHLYADRLWDQHAQSTYKEFFSGDPALFQKYRREIGIASAYLFHHRDWAEEAWEAMCALPRSCYDCSPDFPASEIAAYLENNRQWHKALRCEPSALFPPAFIDRFTDQTAESFRNWMKD